MSYNLQPTIYDSRTWANAYSSYRKSVKHGIKSIYTISLGLSQERKMAHSSSKNGKQSRLVERTMENKFERGNGQECLGRERKR